MDKDIDLDQIYIRIFYNTLSEYEKGRRSAYIDSKAQVFFSNYLDDYTKRPASDYLKQSAKLLDLPNEVMASLFETARATEGDIELEGFFKYCCSCFYHGRAVLKTGYLPGESLINKLKTNSALFPVLVLAAGIGRLEAYYEMRKISWDILFDTLSDIKVWILNSHRRYGIWGVTVFPWLMSHLSGRLYKLGRLQYAPSAFTGGLHAFKNVNTGEVIALSEPSICYRKDGLINGTNDIFEMEGSFESQFKIEDHSITGNCILPSGTVQREKTTLNCSEWKEVLKRGDILIALHIPEGGKMDFEQCGLSLKMADEFFTKYYPEVPYKGFSCGSWLLDPQLQQLLPESSNMIRFQKEVYLYPIKCGDEAIIDRVFGCTREEFDKVSAITSLQRSIKGFMDAGGRLHSAGMFLLKEDLNWGSQVYQRQNREAL